jgi:hypothetical protein
MEGIQEIYYEQFEREQQRVRAASVRKIMKNQSSQKRTGPGRKGDGKHDRRNVYGVGC